jgi:predicted RNA-binding Zn-ribbon protein involved in translation (DUF1610 family)
LTTTEPQFVTHCDEPSCDLGRVEYECPACGKSCDDYGELWWGRDKVYAGKVVRFACSRCDAKLAMLKAFDDGYAVARMADVIDHVRNLLEEFTPDERQGLLSA